MATLLSPGNEFRITHQEMIKGISRGNSGKNFKLDFEWLDTKNCGFAHQTAYMYVNKK